MFRFADPTWLWALAFVPFLALLFVRAGAARRAALARFADVDLVQKLTGSVDYAVRRWKMILQIGAAALLAVALARPQFGSRVETVQSRGQDIMIAVDLSQSMLAEDVTPNRLDRARLTVTRLLERLDGDRVGLVAFAADAFVQSPLTVDYRAAAMFLSAMHPDLMPIQGTDLGQAIRVSLDALAEAAREEQVLIIITDAEDHEAGYDDVIGALRQMEGRVFIVTVGTTDGAPIPIFDDNGNQQGFLRDEDGSVVTTRVGDAVVRELAQEGRVEVVQAGVGGTELDAFIDNVAAGDGEAIDARQITQFEEQYQLFLALAVLLLLAETMMSDRKRKEDRWQGRFAS